MENATGTRQKALALNLDAKTYGTFAEIGAGQEVARWFFSAGGAAGTVAKTGSAYDMLVSDAVYGPTQRYVSRQRLQAVLERQDQDAPTMYGPAILVGDEGWREAAVCLFERDGTFGAPSTAALAL